jgi:hypothetical protein
MNTAQLAILRDRLAKNRQPVYRGEQYSHPRGWNDCLDFVERTIKEVLGEEVKVPE